MAKKEPLYPHVAKSKIKVIKTGDRDWFKIGIHLKNPSRQQIIDAKEDAINKGFNTVYVHLIKELYYCAIEEYHPHSEIVQVETTEKNPQCPYCHGIMTLGNYWGNPCA